MNTFPPLDQLANDLIAAVESMIEQINTTPKQLASSFTANDRSNYIYVLYSEVGIPLRAGVVTGTVNKRDTNALQMEIRTMVNSGLVVTYRMLELGSERLARQIGVWFSDLFGAMLPLANLTRGDVGRSSASAMVDDAQQAPRTRRASARKRGRPGRPRKSTAISTTGELVAEPKRRGRPRKADLVSADAIAPNRRRKANGDTPSVGSKKRRGRQAKGAATLEMTATKPKKRGRPRSI